jgi:hypothetical protein
MRSPYLDVQSLSGISAPLGYFDPLGFADKASEGKVRFYREVELKHGRLAMLAALGFPVAEQLHPALGGVINKPSVFAIQDAMGSPQWNALVFGIVLTELLSLFTFNSPFGMTPYGGEFWSIRSDYEPGNLGFDPLNLKPTNERDLKDMKTKELNNGRLAMIAIIGMIAQELVTGKKLF